MSRRKTKNTHTSSISEETRNYYKRVSETLAEEFPSSEEKDLFVSNVFGVLSEEVVAVCTCPSASHTVEALVAAATADNLLHLLTAISQDWQLFCTDTSASHVLQTAISHLPRLIAGTVDGFTGQDPVGEETEEPSTPHRLAQALLNLANFILPNMEQQFTHVYASHIIRAVMQVLGGVYVGENVVKSRAVRSRQKDMKTNDKTRVSEQVFDDYSVPPVFRKKLKKLARRIFKLDSINACLTDSNGSPVIQTLLLVLNKTDHDLCQKYIHKVIKRSRITDGATGVEGVSSTGLPPVVADSIGSYLIEQILSLTSEPTFGELYQTLFQGRLLQFALHPSANFVLQRLIARCTDREIYGKLFADISCNVEDILAVGHVGVIVSLAEASHRLGMCQDQMSNLLMDAFHCWEPAERQCKLATLLASFTTYETFFTSEDGTENQDKQTDSSTPVLKQINFHGSRLLQHMLRYSSPHLLVSSLLELTPAELNTMSCDPCGSHVIDTMFQSKSVKEKAKETFLHKIEGFYVDMACNKNGSRTLDAIWKYINVKQKGLVAAELCKQEDKIRSDRFGHFVHRNFALRLYVNRRNEWMGVQGTEMKKRKLFKDILELDAPSKKSKKRPVGDLDRGQDDVGTNMKKEADQEPVTTHHKHKQAGGKEKGRDSQPDLKDVGEKITRKKEKKRKSLDDMSLKKRKKLKA